MIGSAHRSRAWCFTTIGVLLLAMAADLGAQEPRVLVFSKTAGFRHDSISAGAALAQTLGQENAFGVDVTEDAAVFSDEGLAPYGAVIWLNTTGDVLDAAQQAAFERYIGSGGGYVGVHSAADTEYDWPWYGDLLGGGAWFLSHPAIQSAELAVEDPDHPSTTHYPASFVFTDEWYNFRTNPRPAVNVLLTIDETTYDPGADRMGDHPIAWSHHFEGGRAWYTSLGHRGETYADPDFQRHLLGGILWAASSAGNPACPGDCNADGRVTIDELVRGVSMALGDAPIGECPAFDGNADGLVTVDELVSAVDAALAACP